MKFKKTLGVVLIATMLTAVSCGSKQEPTTAEPVPAETEATNEPAQTEQQPAEVTNLNETITEFDGQSIDTVTSASIVPAGLVQTAQPTGFTDSDKVKVLIVLGDPRKDSVTSDLANTAINYFQEVGMEVELRDLYEMEFNPVLYGKDFYYAKDGFGEPTPEIKAEQDLVTKASHIVFIYPNWHDSEIAIIKGYKETVFAKQFAYESTPDGLDGKLDGKTYYTIMNAGFLGGGRGYIGDGVGISDDVWDEYMTAFQVFDNDTSGFWGAENLGRFVNDRTPKNTSENYEAEINELRDALRANLDKVYFAH